MGTYRYLQDSKVESHPLIPGTEAHGLVCQHFGLDADADINTFEEAFSDNGWWFTFGENRIIALEANEDQEIPDPEELQPIASIFTDGSWFEWEVGGEDVRTLFENGEMIGADEIRRLFPAEVFSHQSLDDEIKWVAQHLSSLKHRRANLNNQPCDCTPCTNCGGVEKADDCTGHNAVDCVTKGN